jgi:hypothetical protein
MPALESMGGKARFYCFAPECGAASAVSLAWQVDEMTSARNA